MLPGETPWDLEQRLKSTIREANMMLMDTQHRAWFVASLTPHLRMALPQQKLSTQAEALEMAMRLHERSIQDLGLGVQQIHTQLEEWFLAGFHQQVQKQREKSWHDHHIKLCTFKENNLVLLYDKKFEKFNGKL